MFDKWKKIGSDLVDATVEGYEDSKTAASGAIDGARATVAGKKVINGGVKKITITKDQLTELTATGSIPLDDKATDDGYDQVIIQVI